MSTEDKARWTDTRWPVWFDGVARDDAVFLIEDGAPRPPGLSEVFRVGDPHPFGCACCAGRTPAAEALSRLILRAASQAAFAGVVVVAGEAGRAAVADAMESDRVARARFRRADAPR